MKYFSTFSGIGGFELGIQQAYERLSNSSDNLGEPQTKGELSSKRKGFGCKSGKSDIDELQPTPVVRCVGYSEIDPECQRCNREGRGKIQPKTLISKTRIKCDTCGSEKEHPALQIYEKHFNHKNYGDITKINPKELQDFDLLVGGFPCQSFSIAGKRGGFSDTRGTLFFEIARIVREKQPRLLLLENVKGLLSHDKGQTLSPRLMSWGMTANGKLLTARITESHKTGKECSLLDILEERPDQKYFLSEKMTKYLMERMNQTKDGHKPRLVEH